MNRQEQLELLTEHYGHPCCRERVVESRPRCATLALGTIKAAVRRYQRQQEMREAGVAVEDDERIVEPFTD